MQLSQKSNTVFYSQFYFVNSFAQGNCNDFKSFVANQLVIPDDSLVFSSIQLNEQAFDYGAGKLSKRQTYSCTDRNVVRSFTAALSSASMTQSWVCGNHEWTVFQCAGNPSLCVDCTPQCDDACPFPNPVVNPCGACSENVASSLFLMFHVDTLILYPTIFLPLVITASRQSITVGINATGSGSIYCAAFDPAISITSALQVQQAGTSVQTSQSNGMYQLVLPDLMPSSNYSVYCFSQDYSGHLMSFADVVDTFTSVTTLCCRSLEFVNFFSPVPAFDPNNPSIDSVYTFSFNSRPSVEMEVAVSIQSIDPKCADVGIDPVATPLPKSFMFPARSMMLSGSFIIHGDPGCYEVTVSAIGDEFYSDATKALTIYSTAVPPPPPKLISSLFSNDGLRVLINFASACDWTAYSGVQFNCSALFDFKGSSDALCASISRTQVASTLSLSSKASQLQIGDNITLKAGVLKSVCLPNVVCEFGDSSMVTVEPPSTPAQPFVSLSAANAISFCSDLVLDPTQSTGQSGRSWLWVKWEVTGLNAEDITNYLNENFPSTNEVVTVPSTLLGVGTFTISLAVQNFLLQSSSAVSKVLVSADASIPTLSIAGAKTVSTFRPQSLSLFALAVPSSCSANSTSNLIYSWSVYQGATFDRTLVSRSLDPRFFNLATYTLDILTSYLVQVKLSLPSNPTSYIASAQVTVVVGQSGVTASLIGGSTRTVSVSDEVTIDASSSLDVDYPTTGTLTFQWSCFEKSPKYGSLCPNMNTYNSSKVVVLSSKLLPNASSDAESTTLAITVVVAGGFHSISSASVTLVVVAAQIPSVSIGVINSKYNAASNIILTGTISASQSAQAVWSWAGARDLSTIALTPTSVALMPGVTTFQLAVAANALTAGLSYAFTLGATYSSTSSQVMVRSHLIL